MGAFFCVIDITNPRCYARPMDRLRYLVVEGPIGVGKSTLAAMLAEDLKARLVLEEASQNPFLGTFYQNRDLHAFQTQLFFLLSRYRQQMELKQQDLFNHITVCDYLFAKDRIFASLNLSPEELDLYHRVYDLLDERIPKPDLVVLLQASSDVLKTRIKKRNAEYEKGMEAAYVDAVAQAYNKYFFKYQAAPLLVVNTSGIDFVNNQKDYAVLKKELYAMWKSGKDKHYVTIDNR